MAEPTHPPSGGRASKTVLWILAGLLLIIYAGVRIWLYLVAKDESVLDPLWDRYTFIVGGFDSIVTVVITWLFGREVHRKAYQDARSQEADARAKHVDAERRAAHGASLATALRGILKAADATNGESPEATGADLPGKPQPSLEHLVSQVASVVEQFFPEDQSAAAGPGDGSS
jgi:hypothetical protein